MTAERAVRAALLAAAIAIPTLAGSPAAVPPWATAILPSGASFAMEVVSDDASRANGYMGRERVGAGEGMLFWYPASGRYAFWMKNCRVPLDIVWLDAGLRVVHVVSGAAPCPPDGPCPLHEPPGAARYVMEFAAGTAREHRMGVGSVLVVLAEPPFPWEGR